MKTRNFDVEEETRMFDQIGTEQAAVLKQDGNLDHGAEEFYDRIWIYIGAHSGKR